MEKDNEKYVAIYCRVSTREQAEEGYSLDAQEEVCRNEYIKMGYGDLKIEVYREEGISGKDIKGRPEMQRLLKDVERGKVAKVIAWKLTRISRRLEDAVEIAKYLMKYNVEFKTLDAKIDLTTPSGKLQFNMMASIAEFERETIVENVKLGMKERAKGGDWNGGVVLGYRSIREDNKTRLVVDEKEAQLVKRIYKEFLEGMSYRAIANMLNEEGIRTKKNGLFNGYGVKYILSNSVYISKVSFNKRNGRKIVEKEEFEGRHDAIIDKNEWDKVQEMISMRTTKPSRTINGSALLTGLMKCPLCGNTMVYGTSTSKRKDGTKSVYRFYRCSQRTRGGNSACKMKRLVNASKAEEVIINKIRVLTENNKLLEDIIEKLNEANLKDIEPLQKEKTKIKNEIEKAKGDKDKVFELYTRQILGEDDIKEQIQRIKDKISAKQRRLLEIEKELNSIGVTEEINAREVKELLKKIFDKFEVIEMEKKKIIIHLLIKQIYITEEGTIDRVQMKIWQDICKTEEMEEVVIEI